MKRVYLILTLFMTSFFFISINEVKADTFDYTIPSDEISVVETDYFKQVREATINKANTDNKYYLITIKVTDINTDNLIVNLFDKGDYNISDVAYNQLPRFNYNNVAIYEYKYSSSSGTLSLSSRNYYPSFNFQRTDEDSNIIYSQKVYLDSNIELLPFSSTEHTVNLIYNDFTYTVNPGEHFPSLYELSLLANTPVEEDKFIDEKEVMNNFYSTIALKIGDLATSFATNYTFIVIFGIFILTFVFELIWRRFL